MTTNLAQLAVPHARPSALPAWLVGLFAVDPRALAVVRIGVGTVLLYDLFARLPDLTAHYTDSGVLPRSARLALTYDFCEPWWMSLHMLSGAAWWQGTLFALAGVAAVLVLIGYQTKPALLASLLLLLSLHGRFPLLLQGGDVLLRCLLFWLLFLPLDARWRVRGNSPADTRSSCSIASWGSVGLLTQLGVMYFFSALLKSAPCWRSDFSATYYALANDQFTTAFGQQLLNYPRLLQWLTLASLLLEAIGPLLLLAPMGNKWVRIWVPVAFIGFHLGLALCMDLGTFPWICILYWVALLPPAVWNQLERLGGRAVGKTCSPSTESAVRPVGSTCANLIAAFFLGYVLLLNVNRLEHRLASVGRPPLSLLGKATGLEQYWNMFAPSPFREAIWLRVEGELADGTLVNLYRPDEPLPDSKPPRVSATFANQYWRRAMLTLYEFEEPAHQAATLRYFARRWNAQHDPRQQVIRTRLVKMQHALPSSGLPISPQPERRVLCELSLAEASGR